MKLKDLLNRHKFEFFDTVVWQTPTYLDHKIHHNLFRCKKCHQFLYLPDDKYSVNFTATLGCKNGTT